MIDDFLLPGTLALIGVQTVLMIVDELYYHRRRGLGVSEAAGHAMDTCLFLAAVSLPSFLTAKPSALAGYALLALVSSLVITKDEWVHASECKPGEQWLHSLLFVLHAPVLIGFGLVWVRYPNSVLIRGLPGLVAGWALYQTTYWIHHHVQKRLAAKEFGQQRLLRRFG